MTMSGHATTSMHLNTSKQPQQQQQPQLSVHFSWLTFFFTIRLHAQSTNHDDDEWPCHHLNTPKWQQWQQQQGLETQHISSPWVCFLSIPIFYLLTFFLFTLELTQWQRIARPPRQHIEMAVTAAATMAAVGAWDADTSGKFILFFAQLTFVSFFLELELQTAMTTSGHATTSMHLNTSKQHQQQH